MSYVLQHVCKLTMVQGNTPPLQVLLVMIQYHVLGNLGIVYFCFLVHWVSQILPYFGLLYV